MIKAVYVVNRDGLPLYYTEIAKNDNVARATLFSGVISAIQYLLKDIEIGEAREVSTTTNDILLEIAQDFGVILVLDHCSDEEKASLRTELTKLVTILNFNKDFIELANYDANAKEKIDLIVMEAIDKFEGVLNSSQATKKMKELFW